MYHLLDFKCLGFARDVRFLNDAMLKMILTRGIRRSPTNWTVNIDCDGNLQSPLVKKQSVMRLHMDGGLKINHGLLVILY